MSIYPNYNVHHVPTFSFKAKEIDNAQNNSNPIQQSNVNFKGTEALAAYNYNLVNKNNDFNIPNLPLIPVPNNIEDVIGEKVFTPDGKLNCIIQDNGKHKIIYKNDEYKTIQVVDKNTNKVIREQGCFVANTNEVRVTENINDKIGYFADYDEKDGKMVLIGKGKHIYYDDDTKKEYIHWVDSKEYQLIERSNVSEDPYSADKAISYDENGNIKEIENFNNK